VPVQLERSGDSPGDLAARLPAGLAAGGVLSFEIICPISEKLTAVLLQPGGQSLPLYFAGNRRQKLRFLTPRFQYAVGEAEIRIPVSAGADPKRFRLQLWRWTQAPGR
jgi:hypothetical protein